MSILDHLSSSNYIHGIGMLLSSTTSNLVKRSIRNWIMSVKLGCQRIFTTFLPPTVLLAYTHQHPFNFGVSPAHQNNQLHQQNCDGFTVFAPSRSAKQKRWKKRPAVAVVTWVVVSVKFGDGKSHQEWYPRCPCSIQSKVSCHRPNQLSPRSPWFGRKKVWAWSRIWQKSWFFFVLFKLLLDI